ncbi:MAG: lipopolysaccharide heptosyltransferase family protein, partial [Deltaproteobacteria bacterium]|nr:lipopolysaccharide heptosyltransferase family protein [Deltaproteobacteria bacterium]
GKRLVERGRQPVVVWGPGEQPAAIALCEQIGVKSRLAPPTDIPALGALMAAAQCTVTHNSGPMHLSVAVGAPTLGIFKDMPAERWGYRESPHALVDVSGEADPRPALLAALDRFLDAIPVS